MRTSVSRSCVRGSYLMMLALILTGCLPGLVGRGLPVGHVAPELAVEGRDGDLSLGELRGSVVILSFWSST
jgi:hypothetical protein